LRSGLGVNRHFEELCLLREQQTEVLVVGAGPVGMLTALLLSKGGVSVRIIDQEW
jgi:ribulose 1,5-bisphosphate synthetase/thiazole synthase